MMSKPIDAEAILKLLSEIRRSIPFEIPSPPDQATPKPKLKVESMQDFELATVVESLERLTAELSQAIEQAHAKGLKQALEIYYAAEELARDPANAHLIPHVEAMRQAYEHDYGKPIPPK